MIIRKAIMDDLETIRNLNQQLFYNDVKFDKTLDVNWPKRNTAYFKKKINSKNAITFIGIFGFNTLQLAASSKISIRDCWLRSKNFRGKYSVACCGDSENLGNLFISCLFDVNESFCH